MAENRAAFSLRRRLSLGFSKCRWLRTTFKVPSRSIFFFNRRRAFSTGSPFLKLISVKFVHILSKDFGTRRPSWPPLLLSQYSVISMQSGYFSSGSCQWAKAIVVSAMLRLNKREACVVTPQSRRDGARTFLPAASSERRRGLDLPRSLWVGRCCGQEGVRAGEQFRVSTP